MTALNINHYLHRTNLSQISKDSQKAILIGKGGAKLKELGTMAREKLEKVNLKFIFRVFFI